MTKVKNSGHVSGIFVILLWFATAATWADRLHHIDGSIVEGKIIDTGDPVRIDTKYGRLSYERKDLLKIERTAATVTATSGTVAAAPVNLMRYVPQGPVNPLAPPQIPMLVTLTQQPAPAPGPAINHK